MNILQAHKEQMNLLSRLVMNEAEVEIDMEPSDEDTPDVGNGEKVEADKLEAE